MQMTTGEIAALVGGEVSGDPSVLITGVNGIEEAGVGDLCFVRSHEYLPSLARSKASAVLIQEVPDGIAIPAILVAKPDIAFAIVLKYCESLQLRHPSGIHPRASVHPGAVLGADVAVGACAVIEDGADLGAGAVVYAGVYIGRDVRIGPRTVIYPNVTIRE